LAFFCLHLKQKRLNNTWLLKKQTAPSERVHDLAARLDNVGMRKPYASDIGREKFAEILPVLQSVRKRTKPTTVDLYEVFCAVLYLLRTGCQWRMLPRDFPKWRTVHSYFAKWSEPGQDGMSALERAFKKSGWRGPRETGTQRQADTLNRGRAEREEHGHGRQQRL
jgi:transposase